MAVLSKWRENLQVRPKKRRSHLQAQRQYLSKIGFRMFLAHLQMTLPTHWTMMTASKKNLINTKWISIIFNKTTSLWDWVWSQISCWLYLNLKLRQIRRNTSITLIFRSIWMQIWLSQNRIREVSKTCWELRSERLLRLFTRIASIKAILLIRFLTVKCTFKNWWGSFLPLNFNSKRKNDQLELTVHNLTNQLDNPNRLASLEQLRCLNSSNSYYSKHLGVLLVQELPKGGNYRLQAKQLLHLDLVRVSSINVETPLEL